MERSAEFYRGAVAALGEATGAVVGKCWSPSLNRQQQIRLWDSYRALLAEAEDREGGVPTAEQVIAAAARALESVSFECDGKADCDDGPDGIANVPNLAMRCEMAIEPALAVIAKWKEVK